MRALKGVGLFFVILFGLFFLLGACGMILGIDDGNCGYDLLDYNHDGKVNGADDDIRKEGCRQIKAGR